MSQFFYSIDFFWGLDRNESWPKALLLIILLYYCKFY